MNTIASWIIVAVGTILDEQNDANLLLSCHERLEESVLCCFNVCLWRGERDEVPVRLQQLLGVICLVQRI